MGNHEGRIIWQKYMLVFVGMLLIWMKGLAWNGFEGCETSWVPICSLASELKFHLECLNFECVPRG